MTGMQKKRVEYMRSKGDSYAAIATDLGISVNTVKAHCRRNNLGARYIVELSAQTENVCGNCGRLLEHTPKAKRKRFCSDKCRMLWWNSHPEAVTRKAIYHFKCAVCGKPFESYGNAHRKYCSRGCFGMTRKASR